MLTILALSLRKWRVRFDEENAECCFKDLICPHDALPWRCGEIVTRNRWLMFFPLVLFASSTGMVKQEPSVYRDGPPCQRRGSLQLWQFLVTLLDDPANGHFIAWTGRGMEFKLIEPEEVSPQWEICHQSTFSFKRVKCWLACQFFNCCDFCVLFARRWLVAGASRRTGRPWTTTSSAARCVTIMKRG